MCRASQKIVQATCVEGNSRVSLCTHLLGYAGLSSGFLSRAICVVTDLPWCLSGGGGGGPGRVTRCLGQRADSGRKNKAKQHRSIIAAPRLQSSGSHRAGLPRFRGLQRLRPWPLGGPPPEQRAKRWQRKCKISPNQFRTPRPGVQHRGQCAPCGLRARDRRRQGRTALRAVAAAAAERGQTASLSFWHRVWHRACCGGKGHVRRGRCGGRPPRTLMC